MGAPNTAVTVPIASSTGANAVRAIRSQNIQNTAPHKNDAGIINIGLVVLSKSFVICGTAMPTNDIGPAKAVTHADNILESNININRKNLIFIPILWA